MLSKKLVLGNRLQQWTWNEFRQLLGSLAVLPQQISIRSTVPGSAHQAYRLPIDQLVQQVERLLRQGVPEETLLLDESAPDEHVMLQAEVMNSDGLYGPSPVMRYAVGSGVGMRQAYGVMTHACGVRAAALLRAHLDTPSQEKLWSLLATYRDAVIELSSYPFSVGVLGWNTLFWECRNY